MTFKKQTKNMFGFDGLFLGGGSEFNHNSQQILLDSGIFKANGKYIFFPVWENASQDKLHDTTE